MSRRSTGKRKFFNLSLDPRVRLTVWGCLLGGATTTLVQLVTEQMAVQRYLDSPVAEAIVSEPLWLKLLDLAATDRAVLYRFYIDFCTPITA